MTLTMQILSIWLYQVGISRVQMRLHLEQPHEVTRMIFFLLREHKAVIRYDAHEQRVKMVEIVTNHFKRFPKSFSYVQCPRSERLFLIESSTERNKVCLELVLKEGVYVTEDRSSFKYGRMHGSVCAVNEDVLVLTGGITPSSDKCEVYSVARDEWTLEPNKLNVGRRLHGSCSFNRRLCYIFGGKSGKNHVNSIEVLDIENRGRGWQLINVIGYELPP